MPARIPIDQQAIADFCRKWHVVELALFGSVLRDDFRPDSDVDVLVTFEPDYRIGFAISRMRRELSDIVGRPVDLGTKRSVKPGLRAAIESSAEVIYGQTA
jgi:predicted nucleotidyltransferase